MSSAPVHLLAALDSITESVDPFVLRASEGGDGWTAAQFAHAALLLLNGTHNAVPLQDMKMQLGRHNSTAVGFGAQAQAAAGGQAVEALVRANQLSLRPYSVWASDIAREAYGPLTSKPRPVITAASAVHLSCMRDMREDVEGTLKDWEQRQLSPQVRKQLLDERQLVVLCSLWTLNSQLPVLWPLVCFGLNMRSHVFAPAFACIGRAASRTDTKVAA
jgi:hypothetical protein